MKVISNLIEAHIFRITESGIEFLLLKRAEGEIYPNIWQMVTGSIEDNNEKAFETAIREIYEETGLIPDKLWVVPKINSFYSLDKDEICMIPIFAAQVKPDSKVKISGEHSEYKWVKKEDAVKHLVFPGQKESVEMINEYFSLSDTSLKFIEILR